MSRATAAEPTSNGQTGCTPAKLCEIVRHMNVLEMMMGLGKMRVRKTPANQAHVTNWRENPALLHRRETEDIEEKAAQELYFRWEPDV